MSLRAEVAVPASIAFLFGSALGLTVGWLVASGGQTEPAREQAARQPQQPAQQAASEEVQLREALAMHQELLASDRTNARLLRTVGEYHAALGEHELALESYAEAERVIGESPESVGEMPQLLFDQALSLAELDRYAESLGLLEDAAELEPRNVSPRLIQVYIYMRRIMPAPPPGFDRREALQKAELLLDDILQLEPSHPEALQLKEAIAAVRRGRESAEGAGAPAP